MACTPGYFYEPELHRLRAVTRVEVGGPDARSEALAALELGLAQAEAQRSVPLRERIVETIARIDDGAG